MAVNTREGPCTCPSLSGCPTIEDDTVVSSLCLTLGRLLTACGELTTTGTPSLPRILVYSTVLLELASTSANRVPVAQCFYSLAAREVRSEGVTVPAF